MRAVHDKIEGPFAIEENIALYGMVAGDATLHRGIRFILHGTITGNLTIETGARAIIHGTVAGRLYQEGGRGIGRASGRDRVCQYVEVEAGAGVVKKKKI